MFGSNQPLLSLLLSSILFGLVALNVAGTSAPIGKTIASDAPIVFSDDASNAVQYRLPNNSRPISYDIQLTTNVHIADFRVVGRVRITIEVLTSPTRSIALHHRQLTIGTVRLISAASGDVILTRPSEYSEINELLTVTLQDNVADLTVGLRYILEIDYTSTLREDLRGFYRSSYTADDGSVRWLAGTHFKPTNARHGFPCFDEPGLRATYALTIIHDAEYFAVSNMPVLSSIVSNDNTTRTTMFTETPSMPTYLVAFVVSDFSSLNNTNEANGFTQHLFARPNAIHRGALGLETGRRIMDAFEQKLQVKYTLPKMDQISVPGFRGGMENWGLIIYGEPYLLYSANIDTFIAKKDVVETLVHEFAHQWFGNLVTNKWWTYNWLNEGFATLYKDHGINWLFPEWRQMDTVVFSKVQNIMIHDSTNLTRPMSRYVESPTDISGNFDIIGYAKSGCVLNMFLHAFTEEKFHKGLYLYLNQHANSVATEEDLFAALQETVIGNAIVNQDFTVANIMSSWTRQAGYPLVTVQRSYTSGEVRLTQKRYQSNPDQPQDNVSAWWIPYNVASASNARFNETDAEHWMTPDTEEIVFNHSDLTASDWLLLNKRQTGYYRVLYDEQNYQLLAAALSRNLEDIHIASRSQLVDEVFDFARTEKLGYGTVFDVVKYLEHEIEYVPWASALRGLQLVDRIHSGSSNFDKYQQYISKLLTNLYTDLGLSDQPDEYFYRQHARRLAIRWACLYGNMRCLSETNSALQAVLNTTTAAVHQSYRTVILCAGAQAATEEQYTKIWAMFEAENVTSVRGTWINTLACSMRPAWLRSALERSLNTSQGQWTKEERLELFLAVVGNRQGVAATLDVLIDRLAEVLEKLGDANVENVISKLAEQINTDDLNKKFGDLISLVTLEEADKIKFNEVIGDNNRWIRRNQKVIDEWIEKNGAPSAVVSSMLLLAIVTITQHIFG